MNSSGIKRGLAVAAVSALTITGLGTLASPALANPATGQSNGVDNVVLVSPGEYFQGANVISTRDDGANDTYRLQAVGGGNVDRVRFQYRLGGGAPQTIATVQRNDDGYFAFEWSAAGLDGEDNLNVQAVALSGSGATLSTDNYVTSVDDTLPTVDVVDGDSIGVFRQPYAGEANTADNVRVSGTSSRAAGTPVFPYVWNGATQSFAIGTSVQTEAGSGAGSTFDTVVDISGNYDFAGADQILLGADNAPNNQPTGTGDAEGYALYQQVITDITAAPSTATVPTGTTQDVVVTVTDQNGDPIVGAQVFSSDDNPAVDTPQYTDGAGQTVYAQPAGTRTYFVNATDTNAYNANQGDKETDPVTVTGYSPVTTSLDADSNDGAVFDFDENSAGDITVQVQDQNGNDLDTTGGQMLNYRWVITAFNGAVSEVTGMVPTETNGEFDVPFPNGRPAGTYELYGDLTVGIDGQPAIPESKLLEVKAGQSSIDFDNPNPDQTVRGTSKAVTGDLTLADGTGLPGRRIQVDNASSGNGGIVQSDGSIGNTRTVTTGSGGTFSVTVKDPAAPVADEDDVVTAQTVAGTNDADDPNAGPESVTIRFVAFVATPNIDITEVGGTQDTPGLVQTYQVTLTDGSGGQTPQANVPVQLTLDHGYFTNGNPQPAAAEGEDVGTYGSLGQSITRTTDGNGQITVQATIGRDTGFDDDGLVTAALAASSRGASDTENIGWDSSNPLNGGDVTLARAAASKQTVGVLPKAPTNERVAYDLFATDQFGNLTDATVTVSSSLAGGSVNGSSTPANVTAQFSGSSPAVQAGSSQAGDQTLTATWQTRTYKYDGNPLVPTFSNPPNGETLTDTGEVTSWYAINLGSSKYTLTRDTASSVATGSTVIETYKAVDQNGEPIAGVQVNFFRTGPDVLQNGSPATQSLNVITNQQGVAQYVFSGTAAGTAQIVAIIDDSNGVDGQPDRAVSQSRATDTVTFTGASPTTPTTPTTPTNPTQADINAALSGSSKGRKDKIKVNAGAVADGAKVTLYKKVKGQLVELKVKTLNAAGQATLGVRDKNGKKVTKYIVVVDQTADSQADRSKIRQK